MRTQTQQITTPLSKSPQPTPGHTQAHSALPLFQPATLWQNEFEPFETDCCTYCDFTQSVICDSDKQYEAGAMRQSYYVMHTHSSVALKAFECQSLADCQDW